MERDIYTMMEAAIATMQSYIEQGHSLASGFSGGKLPVQSGREALVEASPSLTRFEPKKGCQRRFGDLESEAVEEKAQERGQKC